MLNRKEKAIIRCHETRKDNAGPQANGLAALWPALLLALMGIAALVLATVSAQGVPGQYLVLAAPWSGRAQMMDMVSRADGGVVGFGAVPFLAVAMTGRADFDVAMRAQGAWLVLPSPAMLGCFIDSKEERR